MISPEFEVFFFFSFLAFNLDNEQPDYDMDSEDETLLNRLNRKMEIKPLQFEIMIDRLEKASSNQVLYLVKMSLVLTFHLISSFILHFYLDLSILHFAIFLDSSRNT